LQDGEESLLALAAAAGQPVWNHLGHKMDTSSNAEAESCRLRSDHAGGILVIIDSEGVVGGPLPVDGLDGQYS
jgi:hypothetical protein